jgi:nitrogen fixation NifU-like protein
VPEYSATVLDHFQHPRILGELPDPDAVAEVENPACGDTTRLSIRVEDGRITAAGFLAEGCPAAIAASSMTTELIIGRTLDEAASLRDEDVAAALDGLPRNKLHCSVLAEDVILAVVEDYHARHGVSARDGRAEPSPQRSPLPMAEAGAPEAWSRSPGG